MAKRRRRSRIKRFVQNYLDEVGAVMSGYGAAQIPLHFDDFGRKTKSDYLKNISNITRKKVRIPTGGQLRLPGMLTAKEAYHKTYVKSRPFLDPKLANSLRQDYTQLFVLIKRKWRKKLSVFSVNWHKNLRL